MRIRVFGLLLLLLLMLSLLCSCLGGRTPSSRFYVLRPLPAATNPASDAPGDPTSVLAVALGPVRLPSSLDRPQIVTLLGEHERGLAELHRWAEPLEDGVSRVMSENLSAILSTDLVLVLPTRSEFAYDRRVAVMVQEFGATPGGECVLTARWSVFDRGGRLLTSRRSTHTAPAGSSHADHVSAMSSVLADLCHAIAVTLRG